MVIEQRITSEKNEFSQEKILKDLIKKDTKTTISTEYQQKDISTNSAGKNLRSVILRADLESRLVIGLSAAIKQLSVQPADTLFCLFITPKKGDSATHMQEVLLQAFCFENDIYILRVDSADKLARLLNVTRCDSCVLVQRSTTTGKTIVASEEALIDFCEDYWDAPVQPVVQLPES